MFSKFYKLKSKQRNFSSMQNIKKVGHKISIPLIEIPEENPEITQKMSLTPVTAFFNGHFKYFDKNQTKKWKPYKDLSYYNRKYINRKRKEENKYIKNNILMTPHNTGQYLAHIHQGFNFMKRKSSDIDKNITDLECSEQIKCFEDEDDMEIGELGDIDKDMQIFREKKIERRLSGGSDIQNLNSEEKCDNEKYYDEVINFDVKKFESSIF